MRLGTAAVLTVLAAHGGPAATWLPRLRRACFPILARIGQPGHVALTFDDGPDPHSATAASVLATIRRDLRGGGTVLLHDTDRTAAPGCWRSALGALSGLVNGCQEAGWTVGRLAEHWGDESHPARSAQIFDPERTGSLAAASVGCGPGKGAEEP